MMAGDANVGKLCEVSCIEAGAAARHLLCQVHRPALAHEVLAPAHPAVRSGLPGLAAETASVHHDDRNVCRTAGRRLVLHVHLVDGDVAASDESLGLSADEETTLFLHHQRLT